MKKSIVTMGLVAVLSMASTIPSLADEYAVSCNENYGKEYTVSFCGNFSPDGAVIDSGTTMSIGENNTYSGKLYYVYDENATLTMNQEKTIGMSGLPWAHWGYMDGDQFIRTDSFETKVVEEFNYTMMDHIQPAKAYSVIQPGQLEKDKADGSAYAKTYVIEIDGINASTFSDEYLYYFFQLVPAQS